MLTGIWLGLWHFWKENLYQTAEYQLRADRITLVPSPPDWVPSTFILQVLRSSSLDMGETVLDRKLPEKIAAAFSASPWINRVKQVKIHYPAQIDIELEYRAPCCLVAVPNESGYYPVDSKGILLPTEYFISKPEKMGDYLIVSGIGSFPIGSIGDHWGDNVVEDAAQIAALLGEDAKKWGISGLHALPRTLSQSNARIRFELTSQSGKRIRWGEVEQAGESGLPNLVEEAKKERLSQLIAKHGSFAKIPDSESLTRE
ncbi:MAG: cell division protein FtsQ/DivIB [Thermoguttaceae bacterium]